jgi:hypothetical protein
MRKKLIPCFVAAALVFTGAFGASLLTADPTFATVEIGIMAPGAGTVGGNLKFNGRVATRAEYRNNANWGSGGTSSTHEFIVQNTQLGVGYDITPDLGFYMLMQDSRVWGGQTGTTTNSNTTTGGNGSAPAGGLGFNTSGGIHGNSFGLREAYISVGNLFNKNLSTKIGRQKLVFGNQRVLGHFDWSNVGWSFDGVRFDYKSSAAGGTGGHDSNFILFYNTLKNIPKHTIEPYYIWVFDNRDNFGQTTGGVGGGTRRTQPDQQRHLVGLRVNGKPGMLDYTAEGTWQGGRQKNGLAGAAKNTKNINAIQAHANVGVTLPVPMKPRIAFEGNYASGSGANRGTTGGRTTPENYWPTNHLHYGYMDLMGWKNMVSFGPQLTVKPSKAGTFKIDFWWHRLADADDNWYNAGQAASNGGTVAGNNINQIGTELDITYVHTFFGGASKVVLNYGHFFTGNYIEDSNSNSCFSCGAAAITDDDDQDWGSIWWITKF